MEKRSLKSRMILQVHDELVFDMYIKEAEELKRIVSDGMQNAIHLDVPVVAEMDTGSNWLEAH